MTSEEKSKKWLESDNVSEELKAQIRSASKEDIDDMFYRSLEFGTGGLRGLLGPGSNRMNVLTVRKVTLGFGLYLLKAFGEDGKKRGIVLSHDNRTNSRLFVLEASKLLNELGIDTFIFDSLRPTPELSFTVRLKNAIGGIMVTASHNPKEYNGYKVYDQNGCQLLPDQTDILLEIINKLGDEINISYKKAEELGTQNLLTGDVDDAFMKAVHSVALNKDDKKIIKIVFTPQNGASSVLGRRLFKELGYELYPVLDQCTPDPLFTHTLSPNPEMKEAYVEAIQLAKEKHADLILTTDPDADRVGCGILDSKGNYILYTGNQTGALLIDYVLGTRKQLGLLPANGLLCDTIVTSTLGAKIARNYGCEVKSYLTGFKYIGDAISKFEKTKQYSFQFGYEESYGYIFADFCRDKDSLEALLMISEMVNHYLLKGKRLDQVLEGLYQEYGYHICKLFNLYFPGESGLKDMQNIMATLRGTEISELSGIKVIAVEDYQNQFRIKNGQKTPIVGFPVSDVLKYFFEDGSWLAIRPSGTEPKCKFYYEAVDKDEAKASAKPDLLHKDILRILGLDKKQS
jgi:phosphoglucomutase